MKLLTKAIEAKLAKAPIYSTDGRGPKAATPPVIVKFFCPWNQWTWYAVEGSKLENGDWKFFGLVEGQETELGYFHLSDLQSVRHPGFSSLRVERDLFFSGYVLDKISHKVRKA